MNSTKSFFFIVFALAGSAVQAKPQIVQSDIFYEISQGNTKAVKAWLKLKPDLSVKNAQGQTLLHAAVFADNRKMVKMLVKAGVLVNALDAAGKTALDLSVESGHEKTTFYLVQKKAQVSNHDNLVQVQAMISDYNKKIMRRFFIMLPIMLVLAFPAVLSVILCMMSGSMASGGLVFLANFLFCTYPVTAIYMLTLPMQASAWRIWSNRVQTLNFMK